VPRGFDLVEYIVTADIIMYMRVHCCLVEIPIYQLSSHRMLKMAGITLKWNNTYHLSVQRVDPRYIYPPISSHSARADVPLVMISSHISSSCNWPLSELHRDCNSQRIRILRPENC